MILTKERYDVYLEAQKKKAIKEAASKTGVEQDAAQFGIALFNGLSNLGENGLAFYVKDPQSRLVEIAFEDAKGKPLDWATRAHGGQTQIYRFRQKLPTTTRIKLYVATPKSLVKVPFKLTNLALP